MMHRIYHPIRQKLLGLRFGLSLGLILFLGLVPALFSGSYYMDSAKQDIAVVAFEREGLAILRQLQAVDNFVLNQPADAEARKSGAAKAILALNKAISGHENSFGIKGEVAQLLRRLQLIATGDDVSATMQMDALILKIGDQSGLILDPQLETYYLMDIVLNKSRKIVKAASELRQANDTLGTDQKSLLLLSRNRLREAALDLKVSANNATKSSYEDAINGGKFIEHANAVLNAANEILSEDIPDQAFGRLILSSKQGWWTAANELDRALLARNARINAEMQRALTISGLAAAMAVLLALLLIVALANGMRQISQRLRDLADGDYYSEVPGIDLDNDIGVIANALQSFIELSAQMEQERDAARAELERRVALVKSENDQLLQNAIQQEISARELERITVLSLAGDLEKQISGLLLQSRSAAKQMDQEAVAMAHSTDGVQRQAAEAAGAAYQIDLLVKELSPVVVSVAKQLHSYTGTLSDAQCQAIDAVNLVESANQRIAEFNVAASHADSMLNLISNVARTTNMLALNASIEAVNVGEAGRGFMVVAEEVKALASSTREATRDIAGQIQSMNDANAAVAEAFNEILKIVKLMADRSSLVSDGMVDQTSAITKVAKNISTAADALSSMVTSIHGADNAATTAQERSIEMKAASQHVSRNAVALDDSVRVFLGNVVKTQARS